VVREIEGGICAVPGVRAGGLREGKNGLAVILASGTAAGVFTRNKIRAAPVQVTEKHLTGGRLRGVIVNSGNANAFTGSRGIKDALAMADLLAEEIGCPPQEIAVASTGVIGQPLDLDWIKTRLPRVMESLDHKNSFAAARAIMTTDTQPKQAAVELEDGTIIGGIAKGSGMIEPDMATMLAFLYTNADLNQRELKKHLKESVEKSFNMVVVDGDTSTNDMVLITATGENPTRPKRFQWGLDHLCRLLARKIAMDGEGATKLVTVQVTGAKSRLEAKKAAKAIVRSPLVKTAIYGCDPNWGRIIAALGRSGAEIQEDKISLTLGGTGRTAEVIKNGKPLQATELAGIMSGEEVVIQLDLGLGTGKAEAWGCDLTPEYVKINSEYTT